MEATIKSELLTKSKLTLSIDADDTSHDDYLNVLIEAMYGVAIKKTGLTELNEALMEIVAENVALKFDNIGAELDYSIFHLFNINPMI